MRTDFSQPFCFAIVDLSPAYARDTTSIERRLAIRDGRAIIVQDEIAWLPESQDRLFRWQMITDAEITISGANATLNKAGKSLHARILSPQEAIFSVADPSRGTPENRNQGYRKLVIERTEQGLPTRITVQFSVDPLESQTQPLDAW